MEHPITELVSGEDLVEHMLWVAADKPLPERLGTMYPVMCLCFCLIFQSLMHCRLAKQQCLPFKGSAIESRVYAEDPLRLL